MLDVVEEPSCLVPRLDNIQPMTVEKGSPQRLPTTEDQSLPRQHIAEGTVGPNQTNGSLEEQLREVVMAAPLQRKR
jgi:hypothetical protein